MNLGLFTISEDNYNSAWSEISKSIEGDEAGTISCICDFLLSMPHKYKLSCKLIIELSAYGYKLLPALFTHIRNLKIEDPQQFVNLLIALSELEHHKTILPCVDLLITKCGLHKFDAFLLFLKNASHNNHPSPKTEPAENLSIEISETLIRNIEIFIEEYNKDVLRFPEITFEYCLVRNIIVHLSNLKVYCNANLEYNLKNADPLSSHIESHRYRQIIYGVFSCVGLCKESSLLLIMLYFSGFEGFLTEFYKLGIDNRFYGIVCAFLMEKYYRQEKRECLYDEQYSPSKNMEEIKFFKACVTDQILGVMAEFCNIEELNLFFGRGLEDDDIIMTEEAFKLSELLTKNVKLSFDEESADGSEVIEREEFFRQFCILRSPSITHFLLLLEENAHYFSLSNEAQALFCEVFGAFFEKKTVFKRVLGEKFLEFRIVDEEVAMRYPSIFSNV